MKKYLSMICALLTLTAFTSCGDSNSSSDGSEVSENSISDSVAEDTTEEETESETEQETTTKKQVYDLDLNIDFNIASLSIPSFCKIQDKSEDDTQAHLRFSWEDDKYHQIIFYFYKDTKQYLKEKFDKNNITDTFVISENEYMIDPDAYSSTTIFFTNKVASGRIHYNDEDEELVKQIIETIKFKTAGIKTTETKKTDIKVNARIGDIVFKIPDGYEKKNNASDESMEAVTYKYDNGDMINIAKQSGVSQFEWDTIDEESKKAVFEAFITSALSNYFDKVGDLETITIGGTFAVKQNAVYSGTTIPLTSYAFVYGDNLYLFMFTNMTDTQKEVIDSIEFSEIWQSGSTDKETTTEKVTEKEEVTEPSIIETTSSFEPFTISGTGSTVIKDINIPAEFVVYSAAHNGTSNFIAHFYDCNDRRESLVNEIGNYSCTQIFDATDIDASSSGMIEIDADGDWSITFSPVKSVISSETSTSFSGYGANITGAFLSTGNMACTVSHDGSSNFIVHAYELTEDGDRRPVANEIGEYNGQCVIKTKKDTLYFFNVYADGNWTIDVE